MNARFSEIGFEGFEEYDAGVPPIDVAPPGHIDWIYLNQNDWTWGTTSETYNIEGVVNAASSYVVLDEEYTNHSILPSTNTTPTYIILNLKSDDGSHYLVKKQISAISATTDNKIKLELDGTLSTNNGVLSTNCVSSSSLNPPSYIPLPSMMLSGDVKIYYGKRGALTGNLSVANEGHTGKKSLDVSGGAVLPQSQLHLKPNKEYVISAWIKLKDTNGDVKDKHTYNDGLNYLKIGNTTINPTGPIIDGWQKVEGVFSRATSDRFNIEIYCQNTYQVLMDDIRVFPKDGNIQTYVYDPINYRVTEVLDNNNFYTKYEYDEEGNLIILKKETIKGVKTLQESRSNIKSNQ